MAVKARPTDLTTPVAFDWYSCIPEFDPAEEPVIHVVMNFLFGTAGTWDNGKWGSSWDDPTGNVWDTSGLTAMEITGDIRNIQLKDGRPSVFNRVEAGTLEFTLSNDDGRYTQWDLWGTPTVIPIGSAIAFWVEWKGVTYWMFHGYIAEWEEDYAETVPFVKVTAYDAFALMNQNFAGEWTPGVMFEVPGARLTSIVNALGITGLFGTRFEAGDCSLAAIASNNSPLEEMILTADSDGGSLYCDCDGQLCYLERTHVLGRPDQVEINVFGDSCEAYQLTASDPTTDDNTVANYIPLRNIYNETVIAQDNASIAVYRKRSYFMHQSTNLLWLDPTEGQALADYLLSIWSQSYLRYETVEAATAADKKLLDVVFDMRLYDQMQILRNLPQGNRQILTTSVIEGRQIEVDASKREWTFKWVLSPSFVVNALTRWDDGEVWDTSVWSY